MNLSRPAGSSVRARAWRRERNGVAARLLGGVLLLSGLVPSFGQVGPPTLENDFRNVFSAVPRNAAADQSVTINATATTTVTPATGTWRVGVTVNGLNTDVGSIVLSVAGRSTGDVVELDLGWSGSPANAAVTVRNATISGTVLLNIAAPGYPGTNRTEFFRFGGTAWTRVLWPPRAPDLSSPTAGQFENGTAYGGWLARGATAGAGVTALTYAQTPNYPAVPGPVVPGAVRLESARLGRPLVLSAPSYAYGQEISAPLTDSLGNPVAPGFYLREPVHVLITSTVTSSITAAGIATTSAPVLALAGNKALPGLNSTTTTDGSGTRTVVTIITAYSDLVTGPDPFYYSPHAQKVFATQPGTIAITWKEAGTGNPRTLSYLIATSPVKTPRKIYWTENGFNGPRVQVPASRVNIVNVVYNSLLPQVVPESESYRQPNQNPLLPVETKTFWFDAQLKLFSAYNREGRAFVEYLGNQNPDGLTRVPLDYEIVDVVKEIAPAPQSVQLGEVVSPPDGDPSLQASIATGNDLTGGKPFVYDNITLGGTKHTLYAVRQTTPQPAGLLSNEVLIYWEEADPLQVYWPKYFSGYVQDWPAIPAEWAKYSVYARPDQSSGESAASGVPLSSE